MKKILDSYWNTLKNIINTNISFLEKKNKAIPRFFYKAIVIWTVLLVK